MTHDLFGPAPEQPTPAKRRAVAKGYAMTPGSGPAGETCGTCANCRRVRGKFFKCALVKETRGTGTDIRFRSLSCARWTA